ncbi:hypothetical protein ACKA06_19765 [Rossellomorea oryzaecorticis]|uniref:Uncharacterized protein n=1 Tax=Rossellomorea oryzaecorticis TaxID=1396505 RepID=A0ABW8VVN1_9BACI
MKKSIPAVSIIILIITLLLILSNHLKSQQEHTLDSYSRFLKELEIHTHVTEQYSKKQITKDYYNTSSEYIKLAFDQLYFVVEANYPSKLNREKEHLHHLFSQYWEAQAQYAVSEQKELERNRRYLNETYEDFVEFSEELRN